MEALKFNGTFSFIFKIKFAFQTFEKASVLDARSKQSANKEHQPTCNQRNQRASDQPIDGLQGWP